MEANTRRGFFKNAAMAVTIPFLPSFRVLSSPKKYNPKLSFSTLGCPNWSLATIVKFAVKNKYQGVEIRTLEGELDLTKCSAFSAANIATTKRMVTDNNLSITDIGSSASMHHTNAEVRKTNLDEAKRFIDLAQNLASPYVRVFPNNLPPNENPKTTLDVIINGLNDLAIYSKDSGVTVLMETHGDVVKTDDIDYIMQQIPAANIGLVWDFFNMWIVTKEPPTQVFQRLKKYIKHVHVKDGSLVNGKEKYCLLGKGNAPIKEAMQLLQQDNYSGFYSFEWEKMWHKEIEEPEIAIPHYAKKIQNYLL